MRLLNTISRKLEEFGGNRTPLYAILSHRWGGDEITFQDIQSADVESRVGYEKVRKTCSLAAAHGFNYVWIDTCCIDKTSSAELSEAINSMYNWYRGAAVCYAYLNDVSLNTLDPGTQVERPGFSRSRWFTRGWTLQELLSPLIVIFLDNEWQEIGTKLSLATEISGITGIPASILLGENLESTSIAQRMSWASKRKTTRVEDQAYCLLGIFGINMPLLYGEGKKSFTRLQEEIMKVSDDHSLFAWRSWNPSRSLLATSPADFSASSEITTADSSMTPSGAITVNNKGIHLKLRVIYSTPFLDTSMLILPCIKGGTEVAIYARALSEGNEYYERTQNDKIELLDKTYLSTVKCYERNICVRQEHSIPQNQSLLPEAVAEGNSMVVKLLLDKGVDIESEGRSAKTPLSIAVRNGHVDIVKLLLEKGAQLEAKNVFHQTPLSIAISEGHVEIVKLLLEKGAQLESKNFSYQTPLSIAVSERHLGIVKLLLKKGALSESKDHLNKTPLWIAVKKGHVEIVKLLLEKGAQLESSNFIQQTVLLIAVLEGHLEIVKLLLEKGARPNAKDAAHQTPLLVAVMRGHIEIVKLLLDKGVKLELESKDDWNSSRWVTSKGYEATVKLLLEKDAVRFEQY